MSDDIEWEEVSCPLCDTNGVAEGGDLCTRCGGMGTIKEPKRN